MLYIFPFVGTYVICKTPISICLLLALKTANDGMLLVNNLSLQYLLTAMDIITHKLFIELPIF